MRRTLLATAAILASLLVLAATAVLIRGGVLRSREATGFRFALRDAVYAIEGERFGEAREELERAAAYAASPAGWLQLLREARRLPDRELYESLLREGRRAHPASEPLTAALAYEELRAGHGAAAWELVEGTVDPDAYPALYAGALLAAEETAPPGASEAVALFAELPERRTPEPFIRAYEATGAIPFLENGLLLALEQGAYDRAAAILERIEPREAAELGERSLRLLLLASHTLEERERFYTVLNLLGGRDGTEPRALLLQADLRMSARELTEAERLYAELRRVAPSFSPIPYLNGAWLRRRRGEPATELLATAYSRFGEAAGAGNALLRELIYRGEEERARELIAAMEPSTTSKLLSIAFFGSPGRDQGYTPRLWQLLNEEDNDPRIARLLAYQLVGTNDLEDLRRLLRRFSTDEDLWARFYLGYLYLGRSDYSAADALFRNSPEAGDYPVEPWLWHGNGALTALYTGSYRRAVEEGERARELLTATSAEGIEPAMATVLAIQAEALRLSGDTEGAVEVARRAVSIAPGSSSARLVLRNLEGLR